MKEEQAQRAKKLREQFGEKAQKNRANGSTR
jgi:hypothetical protein